MIKSVNFDVVDEGSIYEGSEEGSEEGRDNNDKRKNSQNEELIDDEAEVDDSELESASGSNDKKSAKKSKDISDDSINQDDDNDIRIEMEDCNEADIDRLNELLFCVQGIGKFKENGKIYEKHEFCEPSMRDIHRFLRKDDPENPKCRYSMLAWKVAENDIIPLILNYENNEKIQQLGLVLLVDLTESLPELLENRSNLESMLTDLQEFMVNSQLIDLLARNLADSTAKLRETSMMRNELKKIENPEESKFNEVDQEERKKTEDLKRKIAEIENKSQSMIELIFVLLKQILNIVNSAMIKKTVDNTILLLKKFSILKIYDAIVFHSQSFNTDFCKRLAMVLLELVFFIIRPFTVNQIFDLYQKVNNYAENSNIKPLTAVQVLIEEEKQQKKMTLGMLSSRPNNFGTSFKVVRPVDNSSFVVSNANHLLEENKKILEDRINQFSDQRKKPRKNFRPNNKRTTTSKAGEEIKFVNDFKISENFNTIFDTSNKEVIKSFFNFCDDFLKHSLNEITKHFYLEIKLKDKLEKYDLYHILGMMTFFMEYNRYKEHLKISQDKANAKQKNNENEFNSLYILDCITPEMMVTVYK
jgi:hypothetical protein